MGILVLYSLQPGLCKWHFFFVLALEYKTQSKTNENGKIKKESWFKRKTNPFHDQTQSTPLLLVAI